MGFMSLNRRLLGLLVGSLALFASGASATSQNFDLAYLERLAAPGALPAKVSFLPPSQIDPAYSHVIYVNTATRSDAGQKMWVFERRAGGWQGACF